MTTLDARTVSFTVNGREVSVQGDHPHLLSALRDELGITSAKDGCAPSGQCGCCTVLLDGKAMVSCVTGLDKAAGKEVTTLEGFDPTERDRLARAFAATGALQCGFCTPGFLMLATAILSEGGPLDEAHLREQLASNLCRCTGYQSIVSAVQSVGGSEARATAP